MYYLFTYLISCPNLLLKDSFFSHHLILALSFNQNTNHTHSWVWFCWSACESSIGTTPSCYFKRHTELFKKFSKWLKHWGAGSNKTGSTRFRPKPLVEEESAMGDGRQSERRDRGWAASLQNLTPHLCHSTAVRLWVS